MLKSPLSLIADVPPSVKYDPAAAKAQKEAEKASGVKKKKKPLSTSTKASPALAALIKAAREELVKAGGLPKDYVVCDSVKVLGRIAREITRSGRFAFDAETSGLDAWNDRLYCVSISTGHGSYLVNFSHPLIPQTDIRVFWEQLGEYFLSRDIKRLGFNTKFDGHFIENELRRYDIKAHIPGFYWDGFVGSWLHNTAEPDRTLDALTGKYLTKGKGGSYGAHFRGKAWIVVDPLVASYYAIKDAELHWKLCEWQDKALSKYPRVHKIMTDLEMRVHNKYYEVERVGIPIDLDFLAEIEPKITAQIEKSRYELEALSKSAGVTVDWNVPEQVGNFLFETLKLPRIDGNSTDKAVMEALAGQHPVVEHLGDYREATKALTAFIIPIRSLVKSDGRLHPDMLTIGSDTGRSSCKDPNLFQVPGRGLAAIIRQAFKAPEGFYLVSKDFSGQELRISAAEADDKALAAIILEGRDYYSEVTAIAFGGNGEDYSKHSPDKEKQDLRNKRGKPAVLALGFGAQKWKLAEIFKWPVPKAEKFIKDYFRRFYGLKQFNDTLIAFARKHGYVETVLGRRKHLDYSQATEKWQEASLDRQAMNSPVQGSAADQTKLAYVTLDDWFKSREYKSFVLFQLHDEILAWIHKDELFSTTILQEWDHLQVNIIPFNVPHKTSTEIYERWGKAIEFTPKEEQFWNS